MFHKMPLILLAIIGLAALLDPVLPVSCKSSLYALSLTIKSAIVFLLPAIIFMLLFKALSQLAKKATKMILLILAGVCFSNFLSTMLSYQVGRLASQFEISLSLPKEQLSLSPAWVFSFPKWVANDHALFAGILLGIAVSLISPKKAEILSAFFDKMVSAILRAVIFMIPVFMAGFVVKLFHDKVMHQIVRDYSLIFILIALAQFAYIAFLYFFCSAFKLPRFLQYVKNMLPASMAGFGSMSSAAAMPLTLLGAEKNTQNAALSRLIIPTTVNVHLIGDCFAIPIFAFAVMKNYGAMEPLFSQYLVFAFYFVLAKFSVAAIPGGGILVMLPLLETQLGFTSEMSSLITALYILFDPVITCANVRGNGAFALCANRLQLLFSREKRQASA